MHCTNLRRRHNDARYKSCHVNLPESAHADNEILSHQWQTGGRKKETHFNRDSHANEQENTSVAEAITHKGVTIVTKYIKL